MIHCAPSLAYIHLTYVLQIHKKRISQIHNHQTSVDIANNYKIKDIINKFKINIQKSQVCILSNIVNATMNPTYTPHNIPRP